MDFRFEALSVYEARQRSPLLSVPAENEVRWVEEEAVVGDFCLDDFHEDALFNGAWVFAGGLVVRGALTNSEMDSGPAVLVQKHLRVQRWWLTGCDVRVDGELHVERLLVTEYNHGRLVVTGPAFVSVHLNLDFDVSLRRGFGGRRVDRQEAERSFGKDACSTMWAAAADGELPFPQAGGSAGSADPREGSTQQDNDAYAIAVKLFDYWASDGKVVIRQEASPETFTEELAMMLESLSSRHDPARALGAWLIEHEDVEDVLVEDDALLTLT